jgi:AraC-like DNA-binding protein
MQRDVGLIADDPAVVAGRDREQITRFHRGFGSIGHLDRTPPADHQPKMLSRAEVRADERTDVLRPSPAGLIRGSPDHLAGDLEHLKSPVRELPDLRRLCEVDDLETFHEATMTDGHEAVLDRIAGGQPGPRSEVAHFFRVDELPGVEALHATFVGHRYELHSHDTLTVALVEEGAVDFSIEGKHHLAPAGSAFVIGADLPHTGESAAPDGYTYKVVYIDPAVSATYLGVDSDRPPTRPDAVVNHQPIVRALAHMHRLLARPGMALEADETLVAAIGALQPLITDYGPPRHRPEARHVAVRRARDYLHDHWNQAVSLRQLAGQAGLSPYRLSRTFHRELGMPPSVYQRQLRIEQAKRELRSGAPPASVAVDCGFYDQAHLSRVFKRHVGTTPSRYASA